MFADLPQIVLRVRRPDGTWSSRPVWIVQVDAEPYVRSAFGPGSSWYLQVRAGAAAEIISVGLVRLTPIDDPALAERISAAYRAKYGLAWPGPTSMLTGPEACSTTLRVSAPGE